MGQLNTALQLAPEEFKEKYDGEMPRQRDNVVFVCLAGVRSKTALNTAASLGFTELVIVLKPPNLMQKNIHTHPTFFFNLCYNYKLRKSCTFKENVILNLV